MSNQIQKLFSIMGFGGGKVNIKSNVYGGAGGRYSTLGSSSRYGTDDTNRHSPTTGTAVTDRYLSTYYAKMTEIKSYEMSDISDMIVSVFKDYIVNFMNKTGSIVTIKDQNGDIDKQRTEKVNDILLNDLKIHEIVKTHLSEIIYYGGYHFMVIPYRDETGHTGLSRRDLYDPVVVVSRTKNHNEVTYIARGKDGKIYEIPMKECIKIGGDDLRLMNDMSEDSYNSISAIKHDNSKDLTNRDQICSDEFYSASKPLYYSVTHKVKEYLLKDTIISLLSIKDLVQPLLLMIHVDKGTSIEAANELTKKAENLINKYTDLSAVLSAQFGISDLIDALLNNVRVLPDYSSSMSNMGTVDLNKINQKIQEIRMELENVRDSVLNAMGIPGDIFTGRATKWEALKTSERLNSRINFYVSMLKSSIAEAAKIVILNIYDDELDPDSIEVHMFSKTTVEYNNMTNNGEIVQTLISQIGTIVEVAVRTLETAGPLFDQSAYLEYITTMLKNIDPSIDSFTSKDQVEEYLKMLRAKQQMMAQQGMMGMNDEY